jgi:hypothetical protein
VFLVYEKVRNNQKKKKKNGYKTQKTKKHNPRKFTIYQIAHAAKLNIDSIIEDL